MKFLFWVAFAVIVYTYVGYYAWLWIRSRFNPRPIRRAACLPTVSVVMVVQNEQDVLRSKLQNLIELDYPAAAIDYVVVSDGSGDDTNTVLADFCTDPRFTLILVQDPAGKASGLNQAVQAAKGEIVLFTDARQDIESAALRLLAQNFADAEVGCASGELLLGQRHGRESAQGMGLYWRIEKRVRELESLGGSVIGATGAIYAVRRNLLPVIPQETILDDVFIPMSVARQGKRVIFDGRAHAWDKPNLGSSREFKRKVRTLGGNYQLLHLAPWLWKAENPLRFQFVSHKLLRLLIPFALITAFVSSLLVNEGFYRIALVAQLAFYGLSMLGFARLNKGLLGRMADAAMTFVLLNAAASLAFINFVSGRKVSWRQPGRVFRRA